MQTEMDFVFVQSVVPELSKCFQAVRLPPEINYTSHGARNNASHDVFTVIVERCSFW